MTKEKVITQLIKDKRELLAKIRNLQLKYDQLSNTSVKWSWEDIVEVGENNDIDIPQWKAQFILELMISNHDANYGINWDTIDVYVSNYSAGDYENSFKEIEDEESVNNYIID